MGYVIHPIPFEVLAKMPPEIRVKVIASERANMMRIYKQQSGMDVIGWIMNLFRRKNP